MCELIYGTTCDPRDYPEICVECIESKADLAESIAEDNYQQDNQ